MVTEEIKKYISTLTRKDLESLCFRILNEQLKQAVGLSLELAKMGEMLGKEL